MMCPITSHQKEGKFESECQKERCAWWDRSKSCCAVLSLAIKAHFNTLDQIIRENSGYQGDR